MLAGITTIQELVDEVLNTSVTFATLQGRVNNVSATLADIVQQVDGITSDAIINALNLSNNIYLSDKTYTLDKQLLIENRNNIKITAHPNAKIVLSPAFPKGNSLFKFNNITNLLIEGLTIDGSRDLSNYVNWHNYIHIIDINNSDNITIQKCNIYNYPSIALEIRYSTNILVDKNIIENGIYHPIHFHICKLLNVSNNRCIGIGDPKGIDLCGGIGILVTLGENANIRNNYIYNMSDTGTKTEGTNDVVYDNNYVEMSGKDGIKVMFDDIPTPPLSTNAKVINNTVKYLNNWRVEGSALILIQGIENSIVSNNIVVGGKKASGLENGIAIDKGCKNAIVDSNIINTVCNASINVENTTNLSVTNNRVKNSIVINEIMGTSIISSNVLDNDIANHNGGILVISPEILTISNNTIKNCLQGISVQPYSNSKIIKIIDNILNNLYGSAIQIRNYKTTVITLELLSIENNIINNYSMGRNSENIIMVHLDMMICSKLVLLDNILQSTTTFTVSTLIDLAGDNFHPIPLLVLKNAGCWSYVDPSRYVRLIGEVRRSSAPISGNWVSGDIVYNSSPAPGGYVGWVCYGGGKFIGFGLIQDLNTNLPSTTGSITVTMDGSYKLITPTGACTFNAKGGILGQECAFIITTSGKSSYVLTWGTNFKTTGTLNTGTISSKTFTINFVYSGVNWIELSRTTAM